MPQGSRRWLWMLSVPAVLLAVIAYVYLSDLHYATTDNAYVHQHKVAISAEISGPIVAVAVQENQSVEKGDLLFQIDPRPYQLALDDAHAQLATAQSHLQELKTAYTTADVDIASAQEDVNFFGQEYQRQLRLNNTGVGTDAQLRAAAHALAQARARLQEALADKEKARVALFSGVKLADADVVQSDLPKNQPKAENQATSDMAELIKDNPAIRAAKVALAKAQLDMSRTQVRAPVAGVVSQTGRLQVGQMMMQGIAALTLVQDQNSWVEANFKETELDTIRVGQPVQISVDAYPQLKLSGTVQSIGAGTGSEFSILPAQNATANWVKVTQRVPVHISIESGLDQPLIAGLSVSVSVDIRD